MSHFENKGKKWTPEENSLLMDRVTKNMSIPEIASMHQRTMWAIKCRIMMNASAMMKHNDMTLEEASTECNLDPMDLQRFLTQQTEKANRPKKTPKPETTESLLREIRDLLKIIKKELVKPKNVHPSP